MGFGGRGDRTMRLDDLPESSNIEDRREEGGGGGFGGFGGMPMGRGGLGIGTVVVLGLVGWALGIDPRLLIGGAELISGAGNQTEIQAPARPRQTGAPRDETGRGAAQSAMGPFYCPIDEKVYLDASFFREIQTRFRGCDAGSRSCLFTQAYV